MSLMDASEIILSNFVWLILLIVGFTLVVVEIYLPGFGLPGITGGICLLAGIALYAKGDALSWLVMIIIIVALLCVALSISIRSAARGRLAKSEMVLKNVVISEEEGNDLDYFLNKTGVTTTVLRPTGIGEFNGVRLNVQSEGEFIPEGVKVKVTRLEGNRIFVEKA